MARKMSPNSLSNLRPIVSGEVRNSWGRNGKDGNGGMSLKSSYKEYINKLPNTEHDKIWSGLFQKCRSGDVAAIRLLVELNDEQINEKMVISGNGLGVVILPQKEEPKDE
jgi:hypothetical protein